MILALKTDQPQAEISLIQQSGENKSQKSWLADRNLARDLLAEIVRLLKQNNLDFKDLSGVIVFKGPGSFTGLRIGVAVANTIAHEQKIPIVGETSEAWLKNGLKRLNLRQNDQLILPFYGAKANITKPKK